MPHPDPFFVEIDYKGERCIAEIAHVASLSPEERERHGIKEDSFLVHLFHPASVRSFELFIDEDFLWHTNGAFPVDLYTLQALGDEIDAHFR